MTGVKCSIQGYGYMWDQARRPGFGWDELGSMYE